MKATPEQLANHRRLVLELLRRQGPLAWSEIHLALGREVTEGYLRRALADLVAGEQLRKEPTVRRYRSPSPDADYTYPVKVSVYVIAESTKPTKKGHLR